MAGHQGGVQVDHQARHHQAGAPYGQDSAAGFAAQPPGPFPGSRPRELHLIQQRFAYRVEDPPRRRRGGHRPEQARLITQHRQVADRHTTVGQHHRQIGQHPARSMRRTPPTTGADRGLERLPDTSCRSHISQQPRPDMRADTPPVRGDRDLRI
jgi:hypothetical protein